MYVHYSFSVIGIVYFLRDAVVFNETWRPDVLITGVVAVLMVN